jgi:hypothetical protein
VTATRGVVLLGEDKEIERRARKLGLDVIVDASMPVVFDKTLFLAPGIRVPWDMLLAGWRFLDHWDAVAPLCKPGTTADTTGSGEERKRTRAVIRDLRVMLYSDGLLFVRKSEDGRALVDAYREERAGGGDPQLAFLRAYYRVKPRLCAVPATWMSDVGKRVGRSKVNISAAAELLPLVRVEIAPGRFVKCRAGEEARILRQYQERSQKRSERLKR